MAKSIKRLEINKWLNVKMGCFFRLCVEPQTGGNFLLIVAMAYKFYEKCTEFTDLQCPRIKTKIPCRKDPPLSF